MTVSLKSVVARRFRFLPPRAFATLLHLFYKGRLPNLRDAKTFSELLVAKNLYNRDPLLRITADKYDVRDYVEKKIGSQYLIPLLQVVDKADDIDFESLTAPFVIKASHGYNMTILVKTGNAIDQQAIRDTTMRWFKTDFYRHTWKEWPYLDLPRRVVIEEFLGDGTTPPIDYKFYVFGGTVGMIQVDEDRFSDHRCNFLSPSWNKFGVRMAYDQSNATPQPPDKLDEMITLAEKLATDFHFVRVDLYNVNGHIYFGELTHFPGGGVYKTRPHEFDVALGELWRNGTPIPQSFYAEP